MTVYEGDASFPRDFACAFTGHRFIAREKIPAVTAALRRRIDGLYRRLGVTRFYAGGALGFDTIAAEVVLAMRDEGLPVTLHLLLPCRDQGKLWKPQEKLAYARVIERADSVEYISEHYSSGCMHARNRALIDRSKYCIAYLEKGSGGTAYTVDYARRVGVCVFNIATAPDAKI